MELLTEYDGASTKPVKQDAVTYLNEDQQWTIDFYVNGTIIESRSFPEFSKERATAYAALFKEGVIHPNHWML